MPVYFYHNISISNEIDADNWTIISLLLCITISDEFIDIVKAAEISFNTRSGYITKEEMLEIIGKCPEFSGDKVKCHRQWQSEDNDDDPNDGDFTNDAYDYDDDDDDKIGDEWC